MARIEEVADDGLQALIDRYRERGITSGGPFALHELILEQKRRQKSDYSGKEVVAAIVRLARESPDNLITYKALFEALLPGQKWTGNYHQALIGRALDKAMHHCVTNRIPIVTALVVKADEKLSPQAIKRRYEECKELGVDVGLSADSFVGDEVAKARAYVKDAN